MKLEDLKKGDILYIEYGYNIRKATVIKNIPEKRKIFLWVRFAFFGLMGTKEIIDYDANNFKDFDVLNN